MYSAEDTFFLNRRMNRQRMIAYGFSEVDGRYQWSSILPGSRFAMTVFISQAGAVTTQIVDPDSQEEYVLHRISTVSGAFANQVREACDHILCEIADRCFDAYAFPSEGAGEVVRYIADAYGDEPEFLWEKFPANAIFRRKDNSKWYAALLRIPKSKLGLRGDQIIGIIDLRMQPAEAAQLVDGERCFPGYHMNKKHWFAICLDGSVPIATVLKRVDVSYEIAKKR